MDSLGIAIDGGRYVRINSQIGDLPRNVRLRTLSADQGNALLEFCRFRSGSTRVIHSYRIKNLDIEKDHAAEIRLRIERRSFAVWEIRILTDAGKTETLRIRTRTGLWPLIFPIIGILALLFWLLIAFVISPSGIFSPIKSVVEYKPVPTVDSVVEPESEPEIIPEPEPSLPPVVLPDPLTIYFEPESAVLALVAKQSLDDLIRDLDNGIEITIAGHSADYGTERGQLALSILRATNVASYLRGRLDSAVPVEVRGFGVENPVTRDRERQELNRRVAISFRESGQ